MKRTVVVVVAIGLLAGALVAPADAKKKKKKPPVPAVTLVPGELKYFLHYPDDGAGGCTATTMMDLKDSPDTGCSYTFQAAQEAFIASGQEILTNVYPATEGTPFILDASRKLGGEITLRGTVSYDTYAEIVLSGTVGGAEVVLAQGESAPANGAASGSVEGQELPGPAVTVPLDLEIDKTLDKQEVTALTLSVTIRGVHRGGVDYERSPSHVIVPMFTQG